MTMDALKRETATINYSRELPLAQGLGHPLPRCGSRANGADLRTLSRTAGEGGPAPRARVGEGRATPRLP
jgi:hypothetical protein